MPANPTNTRGRTAQKKKHALAQQVITVPELDVYATIRSFALASFDDKILPDYLSFMTAAPHIPSQQYAGWRKVCETISLQKSWLDERRPQMVSVNGKPFPGWDHLLVVEQVADEVHQSVESIYWQVDAFKNRNRVVAGRKVLKCIEDSDWLNLAELLTIDSRYMFGDREQDHGIAVASDMPVCDVITQLVCKYFVMIVDKEEGVEYITTGGKEGVLHLSTPFLDVPRAEEQDLKEQ